MKNNYVKVLGKGLHLHENTTFSLNGSGFVLSVSLNIPKYLVDFLPNNNVKKGEQMYLYHLEKQIQSEHIDVFNIQAVHNMLLNRCSSHIKMAKSNYYKKESQRHEKLSMQR